VHVGEIKRLVESRGFFISDKEAAMLVVKFDKDKDGLIRYNEFREELVPRSSI